MLIKQLTKREYLCETARRTFSGARGWTELVMFVLTIVGSVIAASKPEWLGEYSIWLWLIPGVVFVATLIVTWCISGHDIHISDHATITALCKQLDRRSRLIDNRERGESLLKQGRQLDRQVGKYAVDAWRIEYREWVESVARLFHDVLDPTAANRFINAQHTAKYLGDPQGDNRTERFIIMVQLDMLDKWLESSASELGQTPA